MAGDAEAGMMQDLWFSHVDMITGHYWKPLEGRYEAGTMVSINVCIRCNAVSDEESGKSQCPATMGMD